MGEKDGLSERVADDEQDSDLEQLKVPQLRVSEEAVRLRVAVCEWVALADVVLLIEGDAVWENDCVVVAEALHDVVRTGLDVTVRVRDRVQDCVVVRAALQVE